MYNPTYDQLNLELLSDKKREIEYFRNENIKLNHTASTLPGLIVVQLLFTYLLL